ncbi:MAG: heparan-alpha-glucosaminide N-acetyltransferase, partial [Candidatus Norongarragalinales archaeon]
NAESGFWFWFARLTAAAFVFIAGVSLWLALQSKTEGDILRRAAKIFCLGLAITIVTWLVIPRGFVVFGVLHCIGLSLAFAVPLVKLKSIRLALLGLIVVVAGVVLNGLTFDFPWLLWLGFAPAGFATIDYFPLAPWFGVFLLGAAFAKSFYAARKPIESKNVALQGLACLGRHSLAVYLLHQPALLAVLLAAGARPANVNLFGLFGGF